MSSRDARFNKAVAALKAAHTREVLDLVWRRTQQLRLDLAGDPEQVEALNDAYRNSAVRLYAKRKEAF